MIVVGHMRTLIVIVAFAVSVIAFTTGMLFERKRLEQYDKLERQKAVVQAPASPAQNPSQITRLCRGEDGGSYSLGALRKFNGTLMRCGKEGRWIETTKHQ